VISCDHFLDAIADPDLELKIRERQPSDLDSTLNIALQLEVWSADSERRREVQKWEKGEGRKIREISNKKDPVSPNNSGRQGNFRQSSSLRHTAPNAYGGVQRGQYPPSSRGQHPTNYGAKPGTYHPGTFARPPVNYGAQGNFPRPPSQFPGCYQCGDPSHRIKDCPVLRAEQQGHCLSSFPSPIASSQQPLQPPQPSSQPDVRPLKDRTNKPDKTCIWVKYRQYKLSALIDTGSDVSIASEDIARRMGWEIHAHRTKEVSVASNDVMPVIGAAYVTLNVAGHGTDSKILIAPEIEGLILGIDWLQGQGRIRWDFDQGRIKFGERDWIKLRREADQPRINSYGPHSIACHISSRGSDCQDSPVKLTQRPRRSSVGQKFLGEVARLYIVIQLAEAEKACGNRTRRLVENYLSDIREWVCDEVIATLSQNPPRLQNLWKSYAIVRSARQVCTKLLHFQYEGKTPKMGSAVRNVSPRRRSNLSGDTGPGNPYSSVKGSLAANNSLIVRETRPRMATKLFEDSVYETLAVEVVQVNEGVAPRMWRTAIVAVDAQRDGGQKGVTDPYAVLLGDERANLAESARASGEAHRFRAGSRSTD